MAEGRGFSAHQAVSIERGKRSLLVMARIADPLSVPLTKLLSE
jgi:hypothetical protein